MPASGSRRLSRVATHAAGSRSHFATYRQNRQPTRRISSARWHEPPEMTHPLSLSLPEVIALTDEAVIVLDVQSHELKFASARARDMLDAPAEADNTIRLTDLLDPDDGRLLRFLGDAATVSSPLIARVRRRSDGAVLTMKGHRVTSAEGDPSILIALKGNTELSRRFRLLAEKIAALDGEIVQRRAAQEQLSQNAATLQRMLIAVRQMSEIDTKDAAHLQDALDALRIGCQRPSAFIIGVEAGRLIVMATSGALAPLFETGSQLDVPGGLTHLLDLSETDCAEALRGALLKVARNTCDLTGLTVWPLHILMLPKAFLLLEGGIESGDEASILVETLSSLMSRASIEADLRHSQKLQAIGELTGGIAHDFNNILAVVLGNAELALDHATDPDTMPLLAELIGDIRDAALRGATLTSRLLSFARKQTLRPEILSLNTVLRDLAPLLRRATGAMIDTEIVGAGGLWKTRLDRGQFETALLNLTVNARDAMPNGGRLTIETANTRLDAEYAAQHSEVRPGQYVMVAVSDTGTGMSLDVIREAFTPFFTTKGVGQGSGLGLSMVFGFVKQSGGHVKIYSELSHGTAVKMYFPRELTNDNTETDLMAPAFGHRSSAQGHILLVEDDPALLRQAERTLRVLGYTVDTALSGEEAVVLLRSTRFDILLTDVVLPGGINGARLAAEARSLSPGIKVLFMSGYTENAIVHHGQLDPDVELLSKPFTRDDLARRLRVIAKADQR
ncbi:MAG: response regulator [Rhodobacteraceae bacterium]|nr:MAG: response regulator [Paracoccaceae bacterium]